MRELIRSRRGLRCVVVSVILLAPPPSLAAGAVIDVQVGKTRSWVYAFGRSEPPREGRTVRVRLARDSGSGFETIARRKNELSEESEFGVRFPRPPSGDCKVIAALIRRDGSRGPRAELVFPCAIPDFGTGSATITSDSGTVEVDLEIADDDAERGYGLMYRRWLASDKGMAFQFDGDTTSSFYMRNTLIPLSIAFLDASGTIIRILDMDPCEGDRCPLYDPGVTYRGALEVNQGAFDTWGVQEGDTVVITEDP